MSESPRDRAAAQFWEALAKTRPDHSALQFEAFEAPTGSATALDLELLSDLDLRRELARLACNADSGDWPTASKDLAELESHEFFGPLYWQATRALQTKGLELDL